MPTGSRIVAPSGIVACLRLPSSSASRSMPGPALGDALEDRRDPPAQRLVHDHLAALEVADDLGGEVVRGRPEAAAGDDQVDALAGEPGQRGAHVVRAVADDDDRLEVDAELAQALGEPRPVAVAHAAGEDLGARDDDAGARAHGSRAARALGAGEAGERRRRDRVADALLDVRAPAAALPLTTRRASPLPSVRRSRRERKVFVAAPGCSTTPSSRRRPAASRRHT